MAVTATACLFCNIIEKSIPAKIVGETPSVLAIEDVNPQAPVHVLVMPKSHVETVMDLQDHHHAVWGEMLHVAQRIARDRGMAGPGFRMVVNTNAAGGQTVLHLHLHLMGGRNFSWPPG